MVRFPSGPLNKEKMNKILRTLSATTCIILGAIILLRYCVPIFFLLNMKIFGVGPTPEETVRYRIISVAGVILGVVLCFFGLKVFKKKR